MSPDAEPVMTRETAFHSSFAKHTRNFVEYKGYWLANSFAKSGPIEEYVLEAPYSRFTEALRGIKALIDANRIVNGAKDCVAEPYRLVEHRLERRRELVGACTAFFKRFVAVALYHQIGGSPDIDLRYHAQRIAGLPSSNV